MTAKKTMDFNAVKQTAKKHSKQLVDKSKGLASSAKAKSEEIFQFVLPNKRRPKAKDNSGKLKKYSNLNGQSPNRRRHKKDDKRRRKAEYLASLPKHPIKRFFYRLHPKRFFAFWFSKRGAKMALKMAGLGIILAFVGTFAVFGYFRRDLPDPRNITFEQAAKIYDRTGETLLYTYGSSDQVRVLVEFDQISDYMKWATIAVEDQNFYNHPGFSVSGVTRAAINNVFNRDDSVQGGSTITQQFIKNALVGDDRTLTRKVKELILAIELERLYNKDEILSFYLNQIPYGALEYGVEAASNGFFNKSAKDLSIDEAAMMAALPQAPSYYSPYGDNLEELTGRQHFVIDQMADQGYITWDEAAEAKEVDTLAKIVPADQRSAYRNLKAPHFVLKVLDDLKAEYGEATVSRGGLSVITSIDLEAQKIAEDAVSNRYNQGGAMGDNAAFVAEDVETGQVIAYVGSRDFNFKGYGSFDAATPEIGRQPGSSFKPYAYAELMKSPRWSPGSIIWDSPTTFGDYRPNNFDFRFPGPMKVRDALGRSRNIPAVKTLYMAGLDNTIDLAQNMGLKNLCGSCDYGLSLVLGSGEVRLSEHVSGYATFARGGVYKPQTYVLKISNSNNEVLFEWEDNQGEQVLDPQIAYIMSNMLSDDVARSGTFGLGSRLVIPGYSVAAKTGTTDLSVDGWLMGYSRYVSAGVWVGNHDSTPMYTFSEPMTGPIWNDFMVNYHKGKEDKPFERPEGVKGVRIDRQTGRNASDNSRDVINDIAPSWFEGVESTDSREVVIDKISKKLATECTPELAKETVKRGGIAPELPPDDPFFSAWAKGAGYSASGEGDSPEDKDDVHKCTDDKPEINSLVVVGNKIDVNYSEGDYDLETVNFYIDGKLERSCDINTGGSNFCNSSSASYTHNGSISSSVRVEIIDEVLYSDDATENTSFSQNLNLNENCGGSECEITWNDVGDTYDIWFGTKCNGSPDITGFSGTSREFPVDNDKEYCARVRSNNGADQTIEFET